MNKPVIIIGECQTNIYDFFEWEYYNDNDERWQEFGKWVIEAMFKMRFHTERRGMDGAHIHILPTNMPQKEIDRLHVKMLLKECGIE